MKKQNGITLIALVITIIVLLILAGVSISLVVGDNGILTQATGAVKANREAVAIEDVAMAWTTAKSGYLKEWTKNTSKDEVTYIREKLLTDLSGTGTILNRTGEETVDINDIEEVSENSETVLKLTYSPEGDNVPYKIRISENGKVEIDTNESTGNNIGNTGSPELNPTGTIPEGATLIVHSYNDALGRYEDVPYEEGEYFPNPDDLTAGTQYYYNNYIYELEVSGWSVRAIEGEDNYGLVLESINDINITSMSSTFEYNTDLKTLAEGFRIPDTVVDTSYMFNRMH